MDADPLPPAFFPVGLNLVGRLTVVIGPEGDVEADGKEAAVLAAGGTVHRIRDWSALDEAELDNAFLIVATPRDERLCGRLRELAKRDRFLLCCIDQPAYGFVAMQAVAAAGPMQIAISTGGIAPAVGKRMRIALERAMDATFVRFIEALRVRRLRNRTALSSPEARREDMLEAADGFAAEIGFTYPAWFEREREGLPSPAEHPAR